MNLILLRDIDLESFRQFVSNKKLKQIHIIWLCLNRVEFHPEEAPLIGIFWYSKFDFMINTRIFCLFVGRKTNTLNKGFQCHIFDHKKSSRLIRKNVPKPFDFKNFPDQKNWILRRCKDFTKNSTEIEAIKSKFYNSPQKRKISKNQDHELLNTEGNVTFDLLPQNEDRPEINANELLQDFDTTSSFEQDYILPDSSFQENLIDNHFDEQGFQFFEDENGSSNLENGHFEDQDNFGLFGIYSDLY